LQKELAETKVKVEADSKKRRHLTYQRLFAEGATKINLVSDDEEERKKDKRKETKKRDLTSMSQQELQAEKEKLDAKDLQLKKKRGVVDMLLSWHTISTLYGEINYRVTLY